MKKVNFFGKRAFQFAFNFCIIIFIMTSCVIEVDPELLPVISTSDVTAIAYTSAKCGGNIISDGGFTVIRRGVCWSINPNPTIKNDSTFDGAGIGVFVSNISGLQENQSYFIRSYATNTKGTSYGSTIQFTTLTRSGTVKDIDGIVYKTLKIGTQIWMTENLSTTRYNDGTSIPFVSDVKAWSILSTPGYCFYNNDAKNENIYGNLYNWYAVKTGKLAPSGWHVPTDAEWTKLENYLIANGYNYDGTTTDDKIAKSLAATTGWSTSTITGAIGNDLTKNNTSGFAALPGGYCADGSYHIGTTGKWWSSSESTTDAAWSRTMHWDWSSISKGPDFKKYGFSVRCVRD